MPLSMRTCFFMVLRDISELELRVVRREANRHAIAQDYIRGVFDIDQVVEENLSEFGPIEVCVVNGDYVEEDVACKEDEEDLWKTNITDSKREPNRPLV